MSTGNENLDLLIKLLNLTTSPLDSEAIAAMRKANDQLLKFNTTWERLLKSRITIVADPFASVAPPSFASRPPPVAEPRPMPTPPRPQRPAHPAGYQGYGAPPQRPQPTAPVDFFLTLPNGAYVGPFTNHQDASAYRARLRITATANQITTPNVYTTPRHYENALRSVRAPPQPTAPVSQSMSSTRTNKFDSVCYACSRAVPAGSGLLNHQDAQGKWRVVCGPNFGHNASYANRPKRPPASTGQLADDLLS